MAFIMERNTGTLHVLFNNLKPINDPNRLDTAIIAIENVSCWFSGSVKGLVNPVFGEEDCTVPDEQDKDTGDCVSRDSSSSTNRYTLPRPQSLNLSSVNNRHDFLLHDDLCVSQNSLDQNQGLYCEGLLNKAAVTNEVGSSLSMDSGNPLGTQSLESLDERSHNTPPSNTSSGEACAADALILR